MIKKMSLRKISITSLALLIIGMFYFFPTNNNDLKVKESITYYDEDTYKSVYLMDKYDYVSKIKLLIEEEELKSQIAERIEYLIINGNKENNIPSGFRPLIPINTKILDIKIEKDTVVINFSRELMNVNKYDEESMIESIIFTITEIDEINKVKIKVEDEYLKNLPNNKKILPEVLDRTFGINKIYEFDNLNNLTKTIIYYVNEINDETYYTPVTKVNNDERDKVTVIIEELKSSILYQSNLSSYLNANAILNKYELSENEIILSFNDKIFDSNSKSILEEVEYTISMSLMDNLGVEKVIFEVNNEKIITTTLKTLE